MPLPGLVSHKISALQCNRGIWDCSLGKSPTRKSRILEGDEARDPPNLGRAEPGYLRLLNLTESTPSRVCWLLFRGILSQLIDRQAYLAFVTLADLRLSVFASLKTLQTEKESLLFRSASYCRTCRPYEVSH